MDASDVSNEANGFDDAEAEVEVIELESDVSPETEAEAEALISTVDEDEVEEADAEETLRESVLVCGIDMERLAALAKVNTLARAARFDGRRELRPMCTFRAAS